MTPVEPLYPLKDVCDLVKAGKVVFSRHAQRDYQQLGYTLDQAKECVACITADEFRKQMYYENTGMTWDDYVTIHRCGGVTREVYVKLRIPSPASVDYVYVTSFHTQRLLSDD